MDVKDKEILEASEYLAAKGNRLECWKSFVYNKKWNRKVYSTKEIQPIFVEEKNEIVVGTVHVWYNLHLYSKDYTRRYE